MGTVFRFAYCKSCDKRYRKKSTRCECGSKSFQYSDWYVSYFALGRTREEKVGNLDLARRVLRQKENEVASGKFRLRKTKYITFQEFAEGDYWHKYAVNLKSAKGYSNRIKQVVPEFGDMFLHQVEQRDIEGYMAKLIDTLKPSSVKRQIDFLSSIFRRAVEYGYIEVNPCRKVKPPKFDNKRMDYLSPEEYGRLVKAAENHSVLKAAIIFAGGTGMRAGEIFSMQWDWLDFKTKQIKIPGDSTKSSKGRVIPLMAHVESALHDMPRNLKSEYVFTSPRLGKPYSERLKKALKAAIRKSELPVNYGWHILRHTYGSWFVMEGGSLYTLQKLLGHASITTTERYAHLAPEYQRSEVERMEHRFMPESDNRADIARMKGRT